MLESLLFSPQTTASVLQSIHNPLKRRYEQKINIQNQVFSTPQDLLITSMLYEELLSHLENVFLPLLKPQFDQEIMIDNAIANGEITNFNE